ncbi:MAG: AMP-binding protein [Burkholderiales bacterium]
MGTQGKTPGEPSGEAKAGWNPWLDWPAAAPWQQVSAAWVALRTQALVMHAQRHSAFYRRHWGGWRSGDPWTTLLPVRKAELMAHFDEWATDPQVTLAGVREFTADPSRIGDDYLGRYAVWTSSGTTGEPAIFVQDASALAVYATLTAWHQDGRDLVSRLMQGGWWAGARSALVAAVDRHYAGVTFWQRMGRIQPWVGAQSRLFSVIEPIDQLCARLNDFQPGFLASYPSMLGELATCQTQGRLKLNLRALWAGGERLTPALRATAEAAFGVPVVNDYGASECMNIAFECPHGRLHVNDDWVLLEPIDRAGRPVPAGEASHSVLLTNLANQVQPIIRYELRDSVMVHADACPCGNPRSSIRVHGRSDDVLHFTDARHRAVRLSPMALTTVIEEHSPVRRFQLRQTGADAVELRLDLSQCAEPSAAGQQAVKALRDYLALQGLGQVHVRLSRTPPEPDPRSGKLRQVVCCVADAA